MHAKNTRNKIVYMKKKVCCDSMKNLLNMNQIFFMC